MYKVEGRVKDHPTKSQEWFLVKQDLKLPEARKIKSNLDARYGNDHEYRILNQWIVKDS